MLNDADISTFSLFMYLLKDRSPQRDRWSVNVGKPKVPSGSFFMQEICSHSVGPK